MELIVGGVPLVLALFAVNTWIYQVWSAAQGWRCSLITLGYIKSGVEGRDVHDAFRSRHFELHAQ